MRLCEDLLFRELSQFWEVQIRGKKRNELDLKYPRFYTDGVVPYENYGVYIGRIGELPEPGNCECLIICVGGTIPLNWNEGNSCVFCLPPEADLLSVFNIIQDVYEKYEDWNNELSEILNNSADYEAMIDVTFRLLGRWIVITDSKLKIVAQRFPESFHEPDTAIAHSSIDKLADTHASNVKRSEPFWFGDGDYATYCINLFIKGRYFGVLSVQGKNPDLTEGEILLINYFGDYIQKAVRKTLRKSSAHTNSVRSLFEDILNCYPVSDSKLLKILQESELQDSFWYCIALNTPPNLKNIPAEYYCTQIETLFHRAYAVPYDPYIAILIPVSQEELANKNLQMEFDEFLMTLNLNAGLSTPFDRITQARFYYRQAIAALRFSEDMNAKKRLTYFSDIAYKYLLKNSIGELTIECVLPRELIILKTESSYGEEYWKTLKVYLDNEMNATETARQLYIHRSTLLKRLDKIERIIDLSTPEKRFYIRYGINLYETHYTL